MSVIVFDKHKLACDSFMNNGVVNSPMQKIWRSTKLLCGSIGLVQEIGLLKQWQEQGLKPDKYPLTPGSKSQLVIVSPELGCVRYNGSPVPVLHGFNKFAIGEGAPFAYGALYMGATAEQAVAAAIYYSPHCNGEPVSLSLYGDQFIDPRKPVLSVDQL